MSKTNGEHRYTLRMPEKYSKAIREEADAIGTTMAAVILRIFAIHYGMLPKREDIIAAITVAEQDNA